MAIMLAKVYTALLAAGSPQKEAEDAATEIAGYENRLAGIERDVAVLKWIGGAIIAAQFGSIWLLLRLALKAGAL